MHVHSSIAALRSALSRERAAGRSVALVPTMGNLHAGHLKLVEEAQRLCDHVVTSIFVNPMQFGRNEDLAAYPRTFEQDRLALERLGCDALFAPSASEIYPQGLEEQSVVSVPDVSTRHCGASRPGHFDGVSTVVCKLFNIVQPDKAVFGLKDYQQYLVIRKMVQDLCFPLEIIGVETHREASGLAMSSRNGYLDSQQQHLAGMLYALLQQAAERIRQGDSDYRRIEQDARQQMETAGIRPDYFTVCNAYTLEPASAEDQHLVILLAGFVGTTRLIDNIRFTRSSGDPE